MGGHVAPSRLLTRLLLVLALLTAACVPLVHAQVPITPNLGLQTPPHGYPNWDVPMNANSGIIDSLFNNVSTGCANDGAHALTYDSSLKKFNCVVVSGGGAGCVSGCVLLAPSADQIILGANRLILNNASTGTVQGLFTVEGAGIGSVFGTPTLADIQTNDATSWGLTIRNATAGSLGGLAFAVANNGDTTIGNGANAAGIGFSAAGVTLITSGVGKNINLNANGGTVSILNGGLTIVGGGLVNIQSLGAGSSVCTDSFQNLTTSGCPGGGGTPFSSLTGGTNTIMAAVVGSGASLTTSGTGSIAATTALTWATPRLLAGNSVNGGANAPFGNKFVVQGTVDSGLTGAQFLGALATGIVRNTVTTGVLTSSELSGDAITSGSNGVTVVNINGNSVPASAVNHQILVATAASVTAWKTLPDCVGSSNALNFTQATNIFTCLSISTLTNPMTTLGDEIYGGPAGAVTRLIGPTGPNSVPQSLIEIPFAGAATAPVWSIQGVPIDTQTGTTFTIPASDDVHLITISNASPVAVAGTNMLTNNYAFSLYNLGAGLGTYTAASGTVNGSGGTAIIPQFWFGLAYTDNTNTIFPVMPTVKAFPNCTDTGGNHLNFTSATGALSCGTSGPAANVTSITGDGALYNNSLSAGAVTLTLANAAAHKFWGNNTGSPATPGYQSIGTGDLPTLTIANLAAGSASAVSTFPGGDLFLGGINAQSGTSYAFVTGDEIKLTTFNNAAPVAVTLSQATTAGFTAGAVFYTFNRGAGTVTITPATSTINGNATLPLVQNQGAMIVSDGTNYSAWVSASPSGSGTVTTTGSPANGNLTGFSSALSITNVNLAGDVTTAGSLTTTIAANAVTAAKSAVVLTRRVCDIDFGDASGSVITNGQLGPQKRMCFIPYSATVVEVDVSADGGTPNIIVGRNRAGATSNLLSSALATAGSGGIACSNTGGTTGLDGATTCSATLQNTSTNIGDYFEAVSGTAGGTAKLMTVHIVYTVN